MSLSLPWLNAAAAAIIRDSFSIEDFSRLIHTRRYVSIHCRNGLTLDVFDAAHIFKHRRKRDPELLVFFLPNEKPYEQALVMRLSHCRNMRH